MCSPTRSTRSPRHDMAGLGRRHARRDPRGRTLACAARPRCTRARGHADGCRNRRFVRVERLPRADNSSARRSRPRTPRSTVGVQARDRPGSWSARDRCTPSSKPSWRGWKRAARRRALPHRLRGEPRRAHDLRRSRCPRLLGRTEPRLDHRRLPPEPRRDRDLPTTATSISSTRCWKAAGRAARSS